MTIHLNGIYYYSSQLHSQHVVLPRTVEEINLRTTYFIVHVGTIKGGQTPQVSCLVRETPVQMPLARVQEHCLPSPIICSIMRGFRTPRKLGNPHIWKEPYRHET